jgi:hypothetical protein
MFEIQRNKMNKYRDIKTVIDGISFSSKKEALEECKKLENESITKIKKV